MTKGTITALPTAPQRSSTSTFAARTDPWLTALESLPGEVNALLGYFEDQAEVGSGLTWWISGGSYTQGDVVFDPADSGTYRAKTTHSSVATSPNADSTNWESAGGLTAADAAKLAHISVTAAVDLDELAGAKFFTADGAITAGETVVLKADGKVAEVSDSSTTFAIGTLEEFFAGTITACRPSSICALGSGKFIILFEDSSIVKYVVATYSGGSWTYGTVATFLSFNTQYICAQYDIGAGHGAVTVVDGSNNQYAYAFTVSGTVATVGSSLSIGVGAGGARSSCAIGNGYLLMTTAGANCNIYAATISGTTLGTLGSALALDSGNTGSQSSLVYLGSDLFAVNQSEYTTDDSNAYLVSRSTGTTLVLEDSLELYNGTANPTDFNPLIKLDDGVLAVGWPVPGAPAKSRLAILPYSGSTFGTIGTGVDLTDVGAYSAYGASAGSGNDFYIHIRRNSDSYPMLIECSYTGTTLTIESENVIESAACNDISNIGFDPSTGDAAVWQRDNDNDGDLIYFSMAKSATDADDWIGIAQETVADTETVEVAGLKDTASGLSSLTIDSTYYVADDGSLTAVANSRKIGRAVSATELFIEEGNA